MNHSEIVSFLWGVADLVRDTFKRGKYQDVILPLTVLRRGHAIDARRACPDHDPGPHRGRLLPLPEQDRPRRRNGGEIDRAAEVCRIHTVIAPYLEALSA